jgi:hypothetical protein
MLEKRLICVSERRDPLTRAIRQLVPVTDEDSDIVRPGSGPQWQQMDLKKPKRKKTQHDKSAELAREVGADESESAFVGKLRRIARVNP